MFLDDENTEEVAAEGTEETPATETPAGEETHTEEAAM